MSCGTPVLASTASSVPEVVGDAGILLDPKDAAAWADAVQRVMQDVSLREDLSRRGLERAQQFTWERCARETLRVLVTRACDGQATLRGKGGGAEYPLHFVILSEAKNLRCRLSACQHLDSSLHSNYKPILASFLKDFCCVASE